jgi:Putative Actinobacterial Holin-X, holin superfamily III
MKGLRWTLAFLRDPISALGSSIATIRERLAPLGSEIQTRLAETLRNAARKLALVVGAAALALVGAGYVLIGLWLGFDRLLGPIGASFLLGAFFLLASLVPLAILYRTSRKPQVASDEARYDVSAGPLK